jgi:RNA polymerase sigma-54 factor
MSMRQGLHMGQRMSLTQTLTPQMRMNLELIQAPILEAVQQLEQQVMVNPWLERDEKATDPRFVRDADVVAATTRTARQEADFQESEAWLDPVAASPWTHEEFPADETTGVIAVAQISPYEQLEAQVRELDIKRPIMELAIKLLQSLDSHGFLPPPEEKRDFEVLGLTPIEEWRERLKEDPDAWLLAALELRPEDRPRLDEVLKVLRFQLEPPGVGACDQSHSFLIQLERQGKQDTLAARIIREKVLADIKPRNLDQVARKLGVTTNELHKALEDLHRLYRSPLSLLDQSMEPTRYPDLTVEKIDNEWQVNLSHPLSGRYRYRETKIPRKNALEKELVEPADDPAETLRRLRTMRQDARMLVRATEYRDRTLYEIGTTLVREQSEFLDRGEEALKPLLQKELAEKLGLNEATVSRILKEKYILTPRGLIPLSGFFSRSLTNRSGEKVSNKSIMDSLSRLIAEEENPESPWSDQELSAILKQRGTTISRRTVTKYRMILKIGAAGDRKAQRKIQDAM